MPIEIPTVETTATVQQLVQANKAHIDLLRLTGVDRSTGDRSKSRLDLSLAPYAEDAAGNRTFGDEGLTLSIGDVEAAAKYVPELAAAEAAVEAAGKAVISHRETVRKPAVDAAVALVSARETALKAATDAANASAGLVTAANEALSSAAPTDRQEKAKAVTAAQNARQAAIAAVSPAQAAVDEARKLLSSAQAAYADISVPPVTVPAP